MEQIYLAKTNYFSDHDALKFQIKGLAATENKTDFHVEYQLTSLKISV